MEDVVQFGNGKERPKTGGTIPVYGGNGILGHTSEYNFEEDVVIIGRVGAYCGSVYFENRPIWISDNALSAIQKNDENIKYLFYLLKNLDLNKKAQGAAQPLLNQKVLNSIRTMLPRNIKEQRAIGEVLGSFDTKIDFLRRQNGTLEEIGQTLFKKWFVDDADEGWEKKSLNDAGVKVAIGRTPPRKELHWFSKDKKDWKWVSIKDMENTVYIIDTAEYLTEEAVKKFKIKIIPKESVILSFKMTVGRVCITSEEMLSNEAIAHFRFEKDSLIDREILYFYLKSFDFNTLGTTSTIVTSINTGMIRDMLIAIPDKETKKRFQRVVQPLFKKILLNQSQICTLEEMRDTLLPKLMSGEVRVKI